MNRSIYTGTLAVLITVAGCGGGEPHAIPATENAEFDSAVMGKSSSMSEESLIPTSYRQTRYGQENAGAGVSSAQAVLSRKIIYTTKIDVVVESFDGIASGVVGFCEQHGGFVARANTIGQSGNQRQGTWVLRIPVAEYRAFLSSVSNVGEVVSTNETSKEVTAEYFDLEARIRNKEREESRLVEILEQQAGKLTDILNVEKEISRVRGEVEQLRGRMRLLSDLTTFSTVTISVREVRNYVPPESPTFATEVARQWRATTASMIRFGANAVLIFVTVGPWLVAILCFGGVVYRLARRVAKRRTSSLVA